jgi:hypothetical protein
MRRTLLLLAALALAACWTPDAHAQTCPFCMRAQYQLQTGMQTQMAMQRQRYLHQQQMLFLHRQAYASRQVSFVRRTPAPVHRMTTTRSVTPTRQVTFHPRVTTTPRVVRMTRLHTLRHPTAPGRERPSPHRPDLLLTHHVRREQVHRVALLRKITERERGDVRRSITTSRPRPQASPQPTLARHRRETPHRASTPHARHTTRREVTHRPTVQLRVRLTATCGSCHGCAGSPATVRRTPALPLVLGRPLPPALVPWQPPDLPGVPAERPRPAAKGKDRPHLAALRPPALAPLPVTRRDDSDRLTARPRSGSPGGGVSSPAGNLPRGTALSPPALAPLEGPRAELPLLVGAARRAPARPVEPRTTPPLLPDAVAQAPPLPDLPSARPRPLALLPALEGGDTPASLAREPETPSPLELVLRPPPLPPLPESELR